MEKNSFYVIKESASWEQVIEKSRFIAIVYQVSNVEGTAACLRDVREEYPNARHYVYAYRLREGLLEKSSDDGEPQGTGGKQIMEHLQHHELWNVMIVVVRYFGGVLLGTGGLSRAYSGTVRGLLEKVHLEKVRQHLLYDLCIPYSWYEALKYQLNLRFWTLDNERFTDLIKANVYVPSDEAKDFEKWLQDFASGQIELQLLEEVWR
jgi:uncharacterized YigZ family protein